MLPKLKGLPDDKLRFDLSPRMTGLAALQNAGNSEQRWIIGYRMLWSAVVETVSPQDSLL